MLQLAKSGVPCAHRFLGPLDRKNWKELRKKSKNRFFRHFSWLDMAISRTKTCSHWPKMVLLVPPVRYYIGQVCFYRFLGPLGTKYWKKLRKKSKNNFSDPIPGIHGHFKVRKISSKSSILVLFGSLEGFWDMPSCFPMFVHVFQATRGVKNDLDQNLLFFADIYKVNGALNGRAGCNP